MEKMERLLFEIENLMKKHQDQQFVKKELRDSFDSKLVHESYLTHAQAKLDQIQEIFTKIQVYDPEQPLEEKQADKDSEYASDNENEEVVYWLDKNYFMDFNTRYNKAFQIIGQSVIDQKGASRF